MSETLKQKARRLMSEAFCIKQPFNLDAPPPHMYAVSIFNVEKLVELAIAEEREACAQKASLWALKHDMSTNLRAGMMSAIRADKW